MLVTVNGATAVIVGTEIEPIGDITATELTAITVIALTRTTAIGFTQLTVIAPMARTVFTVDIDVGDL
jgi:hypothetical protein